MNSAINTDEEKLSVEQQQDTSTFDEYFGLYMEDI
jgi:hypothetical protein